MPGAKSPAPPRSCQAIQSGKGRGPDEPCAVAAEAALKAQDFARGGGNWMREGAERRPGAEQGGEQAPEEATAGDASSLCRTKIPGRSHQSRVEQEGSQRSCHGPASHSKRQLLHRRARSSPPECFLQVQQPTAFRRARSCLGLLHLPARLIQLLLQGLRDGAEEGRAVRHNMSTQLSVPAGACAALEAPLTWGTLPAATLAYGSPTLLPIPSNSGAPGNCTSGSVQGAIYEQRGATPHAVTSVLLTVRAASCFSLSSSSCCA